MSATTAEVRTALQAAIITGLGGSWQVSAYMLAKYTPPSIDIRPAGITYDAAMARGGDDANYIIRAMVGANEPPAAQMLLDTLLDVSSDTGMKAIIEADRNAEDRVTLGDLVDDVRVVSASDYLALENGGDLMFAIEFTVEVYL